MKLIIMQFSPRSVFLPFKSKYLLLNYFLNVLWMWNYIRSSEAGCSYESVISKYPIPEISLKRKVFPGGKAAGAWIWPLTSI